MLDILLILFFIVKSHQSETVDFPMKQIKILETTYRKGDLQILEYSHALYI